MRTWSTGGWNFKYDASGREKSFGCRDKTALPYVRNFTYSGDIRSAYNYDRYDILPFFAKEKSWFLGSGNFCSSFYGFIWSDDRNGIFVFPGSQYVLYSSAGTGSGTKL